MRLRALPFVAALVVSLFAFFTPGPDLPSGPSISDKVEHAAIFAVLAMTGRLAGVAWSRLFVCLLGYAVLSELLQWLLPIQRDGDWHDSLADSIGTVLGLVLFSVVVSLVVSPVRHASARAPGRSDPP